MCMIVILNYHMKYFGHKMFVIFRTNFNIHILYGQVGNFCGVLTFMVGNERNQLSQTESDVY